MSVRTVVNGMIIEAEVSGDGFDSKERLALILLALADGIDQLASNPPLIVKADLVVEPQTAPGEIVSG